MMTEEERWAAMGKKAAEEIMTERCWYYTSFAGEKGFLGATIVLACGPVTAILESHRLGINPGGEAMTIKVPNGKEALIEGKTNRLLTREEAKAL